MRRPRLPKIRDHCLAYIKAATTPAGLQQLNNLYQRVHFLTARAGLAGCAKSALLASAFEALLFEVVFKPANVTASVLQTIAQAVDCLGRLFQNGDTGTAGLSLKAKILIVDDDAVCNYTMVAALKRAHFEPVSVEDPTVAVQMVQATQYDIILLDINMPGMNGFELCEALRRMPQYKETPVIFITGNGDFQNRAQGILSGGNDLITKPTSPLELVLKTTMHLLLPQGRRPESAIGATAQRLDAPPGTVQSAPPAQNGQPHRGSPQNGARKTWRNRAGDFARHPWSSKRAVCSCRGNQIVPASESDRTAQTRRAKCTGPAGGQQRIGPAGAAAW